MATTDGLAAVAYAPSAVPNERFHIMPRALSAAMIAEIVTGFGRGAAHLQEAGLDGVEIVASHGYLPAQFLNPQVNRRDDRYGGSAERRMTFLREVISAIRRAAEGMTLGLRISGDELEPGGLTGEIVAEVAGALGSDLDYLSVVAGSSATLGGSVHVVPPMGLAHGYVAPFAAAVRAKTGCPVLVTGRINQPQIAEEILASGAADLCGMTRALICDPEMPAKAAAGRLDDVRACIGCNQACIGRAHKGLAISCIQFPESGRELGVTAPTPVASRKRVMVAGGGPAGLKAAAVAAARGHQVTLYERASQCGGQALLAQRLPGREEFGGIVTNLLHEAVSAGVRLVTGQAVTAERVREEAPDALIVATGAQPYLPAFEGSEEAHTVSAWDVLRDRANLGTSVAIADWRCDWIGLGLAERLALAGCRVRLCVNGAMAGESLQSYTRNHYLARLHELGVEIRTHLRLFGADAETAFFQDTITDAAVLIEPVDSLVLALGHQPDTALEEALADHPGEIRVIGDCRAARTAEEAVYEGLLAGRAI